MGAYFVGIDIGGTKIAVTVADRELMAAPPCNAFLGRVEFLTPLGGEAAAAVDKIVGGITKLLAQGGISKADIGAVGISCGGPIDSKRGIILNPPNLYGWQGMPIVQQLEHRMGCPVRMQNDANACALAEWKFGAGKGTQNMVFLTMGTGMGAGLILNGRLYSGTNDMAGEIGHIRLSENGPVGFGKEGSFEGFCSGGGIAQIARAKAQERLQLGQSTMYCRSVEELGQISAKTVSDAADAGDPTAIEAYRKAGRYLGKGLAILVDVLNPEMIVLGSIFCRSRSLLWEPAKEVLEEESISLNLSVCSIVPSKLGNSVGDYAAMTVAMHEDI